MKQKSLKINAILNVTKTIIALMAPLITFPYSSRILFPEGIGKVNFANSIVSYFSLIAGLGITTYAVREGAKVRDNKIKLGKFVKEILTINIISTLFSYILLAITIIFVPKVKEVASLVIIISGTILFTTIGVEWFFTAIEEYAYITIRSIIVQIISILLLFCLVKTKEDILLYASINSITSLIISLWNIIAMSRKVDLFHFQHLEIKKHIKPIFLLFSMAVITSVYTILDTSMLGFLASNEAVGYYTAATKFNRIVLIGVTSISAILLPRLSYYAENDFEKFMPLFKKSISITLAISIPSMIGLNLLSEPILLLFSGHEYIPAILTTQIINPIVIVVSLSNLIGIQYFVPLHKEKYTLISICIGAAINLFLNIFLIPKYQQNGAAFATVIAESAVTITQLIFAGKIIWDKENIISIIQFIIASILMGVIIYFTRNFISNIVLKLITSVFIGILSYSIMLILMRNKPILSIYNELNDKLKHNNNNDEK